MSSLQDQLLNAGLIDGKKAKQVNKEKRKQAKVERRTGESKADEAKQAAERARKEKAERDRALSKQLNSEAERKALAAQIKQLIQSHRKKKIQGKDELEYNFKDGKNIKKMLVSRNVMEQIACGVLAVVKLQDTYELVPKIVADKIAMRDENAVVVSNTRKTEEMSDEEDPYKDYVIPDDLMW